MLPTARTASAHLQLSLRLTSTTTFTFRLPALLTPSFTSSGPSTSSSTSTALTPAFATASASPSPSASTSVAETLGALWDGILRAVPKKKVSHSRKSMRAANKGLKDRVDLVHCSACGKPKVQHHICAHCYFELNRARKATLRQAEPQQGVQKSLNPE